ncbi:MAG TPA: NnrS family protein [Accumulibacter sp.]|uniref:NnrS family protein n=1 Tax=Accumulibacter sp. TaxID=2053492 RepID=UPI0025D349DA|nr:NnrS family protein [Accumulibacter sp.]MCM8597957.1 NnrS family protein [Accumulibacter sp.]MCM8662158.1 NnrS family protein [Accumulibacter sp.]HNC52101.1 NnrS family protein [Accumulibacter sp.]
MSKLLSIVEPGRGPGAPVPGFALWALGFRPFYLLASIFAALSVPLWVAQYSGHLPGLFVRGPAWHGHEMLFGYTLAVVTGFLFTAGRNWTGQPTPTGHALLGFALLWIAGRVLVLTPYATMAAVVNAAFPVAVGIALAIPLVNSRNRRNYFFVGLLILLGAAVLAMHLSWLGMLAWPERASLQVGLDIMLFVLAVMGGRVIPMFTNNGIPGVQATRHPLVERVSLGSVLLLLAADVLPTPASVLATIALLAGLTHAVRLCLWQPWRTLATPLVWVLHAAYAWIVVYLVLRALGAFGLVAEPLATHALTIGAIGGMTIGMMTRTARGHTGRPLLADGFEVTCYLLLQCAALIRVFGGMLVPADYLFTVIASGICWSLAFTLYAVRYWPVLSRARLDGKPG